MKCIKLTNGDIQKVKDETASAKVKKSEATYTSRSEWKKTTEKVAEVVEQKEKTTKKVKK